MHFFAEISEWSARVPSAVAASLLVFAQFSLVLAATRDRHAALLSALVLGTGFHFFALAVVAEIDMVFGLFCSLTIYGIYFIYEKPTLNRALLTALAGALAFLAKGPPVIFFAAAAAASFGAYLLTNRSAFNGALPGRLPRTVALGLAGILVFIAVVSLWLTALAGRVGSEELLRQWDIEIFQRIVAESSHARGPLFYFGSSLLGLLPWSLVLIGAAPLLSRRVRATIDFRFRDDGHEFLVFTFVTVLSSILLLSLAEGKSSRYFFPLYPFLAALIAWVTLRLPQLGLESFFFRLVQILGYAGCAIALFTPAFLNLEGVPPPALFLSCFLLFIALAAAGYFSRRREAVTTLACIALTMVTVRVVEKAVYIPHRNATRSVQGLVQTITNHLPAGEPLYTIEMFERWIAFSLKNRDHSIIRLTPTNLRQLNPNTPLYLLLSYHDEWWRLPQLQQAAPETTLVANLTSSNDHVLVVRTPARALSAANLSEDYPTVPTPAPQEFLMANLPAPGSQ
jgi:4-amino-4-deoxy-L-arabinose transferase-like glycosyltransferase